MADATLDEALALLDSLISRLTTSTRSHQQENCQKSNNGIKNVEEKVVDQPETPKNFSGGVDPSIQDEFGKAHLQVGCILAVDNHPLAEKLYLCKVEVAKGEVRQVVAGLRNFISSSELLGRKVCLVLNLKPAKLAGQQSEAMILAGEASSPSGEMIVKVLEPPEGATVGDRIFVEAGVPSEYPVKQLSSKIWGKLVPLLKVEGGVAKFNNRPLVTSSGMITVHGLPDGAHIH